MFSKVSDLNMMYSNIYLNKMKPVSKGGVCWTCVSLPARTSPPRAEPPGEACSPAALDAGARRRRAHVVQGVGLKHDVLEHVLEHMLDAAAHMLCKMSDLNMMYLNMYLNKMKPVSKGGVLDLCVLAGAYLAATR